MSPRFYKANRHTVKELEEFGYEGSIDFGLLRLTQTVLKHDDDLLVHETDEKICLFYAECKKCGIEFEDTDLGLDELPGFSRFGCPAGRISCSVDTDGHVFPCGLLQGVEEFDCGSVDAVGNNVAWLSDSMARFQNIPPHDNCAGCLLYSDRCSGGCRSNAFFYSGGIDGLNPYCRVYKNLQNNSDTFL